MENTKKINISKLLKKNFSKIYFLTLWVILFGPSTVLAWNPTQSIVPNCAHSVAYDPSSTISPGCHFNDLIILINNLLDVFIWLSIPIATILFAWIGFDFIVDGDKSSALSEAKRKLMSLIKGLFWILAPWLVIKVIISGLGVKSGFNQFIN